MARTLTSQARSGYRDRLIYVMLFGACISTTLGCEFAYDPNRYPGEPRQAFSPKDFNFMVIGDWGRKGSAFQDEVAAGLLQEAERDQSLFILSTGDNFYNDGVESVDDEHWDASFENVYTGESLQVPWYIVLGNHDHRGNIQAQIDYTNRSRRWYLPASYYDMVRVVNDSVSVHLIFIDTTPLTEETWSPQKRRTSMEPEAVQLRWLEQTLAESDSEWRVVIGHHPLYSVGQAHRNNDTLIENIADILESRNVHMYFSGHAHSLQHLSPRDNVQYFISGSGSKIRDTYPDEHTLAARSVPGFMAVSLSSDTGTVQFIDMHGKMQYETVVTR